jgi:hypothetical protein
MEAITSLDVAVLFRVGELARRYGIKASEADASFILDEDTDEFVLQFHTRPNDENGVASFNEMLASLGCKGGALRSKNCGDIEDALIAALEWAPE